MKAERFTAAAVVLESTVTPVARRVSCSSSILSSTLIGGRGGATPFISSCSWPVGGGKEAGAVFPFDFIPGPFLPLLCDLEAGARADFSDRAPVFRPMREARGRSSSSSEALNDEEENRRFFDGGAEMSLKAEDADDGGLDERCSR